MSRPATMIMFLLTIFALYGGLHIYLYQKIRHAFLLDFGWHVALILVLVFLFLAPFTIRIAERASLEVLARILSYGGYVWMGFLFLFFCASLLLDLYHLAISAGGYVAAQDLGRFLPSPRWALFLPTLIAICIVMYGYFEAKNVRVERLEIQSPKIPKTMARMRLVQISDVHIGMIVGKKRMERIAHAVKKAAPDLLISTGDLLDGQVDSLEECARILREIRPPYGKWAIVGNHEYFAGLPQSLAFTQQAGFTILRGEAATVAGTINIAGLDDPAGKGFGLYRDAGARNLLSELPAENFTLLLAHRPIVSRDAVGHFDLQLSGHTHKGQIFPFSLVTRIFFPFHSGFFHLGGRSALYVSRGTGTWGPPIRFFAAPEITVIDLVPQRDVLER